MRLTRPLTLMLLPLALGLAGWIAYEKLAVGPGKDGSYTVATQQRIKPAGEVVEFAGRPVDLALAPISPGGPDGPGRKWLYLKDNSGVLAISRKDWKEIARQDLAGGTSMHGILVSRDGTRLWATGAESGLWELPLGTEGIPGAPKKLDLAAPDSQGPSYPCGLAEAPDGKTLYVCLSRHNAVVQVDLAAAKVVRTIPVGIAPFDIALSPDGTSAWVSNWGGRRPRTGERTAPSAGTETLVDERGVANSGTLSRLDLTRGEETAQVSVGLHPSDLELAPDGKTLYVTNANDDTLSIVDTTAARVRETVVIKPDPALPFGSMPNALCLASDARTLYVACGGNNAVAVVDLSGEKATVQGWIPAGWYPGAVVTDGKQLYIANIKGNGSRRKPEKPSNKPDEKTWQVYMYAGTVNRLPLPDSKTLLAYTRQALNDARVPEALRQAEKARDNRKPVPVPERPGEPSVFEHVVYIIKENRTYDQVFGDLKQGDGDPEICIFGREVTPNHHALAERYVLLDNFYCNGVLSADGHSWATEANVTDHLEKAFGGFTRSYTFGDDPLTYSSTGFLWDNALARGLSFVNFGEMDYTNETPDVSYVAIYEDWKNKTGKIQFRHNIGIDRLRRYTIPDSIGWNMDIPDVMRAEVFLRELKKFERRGSFPNLTILYLPNDHTEGLTPGAPTPRAYMADNDLALGQVVEGLSKSKFWPRTCVFVVEDDPQAGFDHVDGHRSPCLVISPYTRRGVTVSEFYNQTAVIHTMERILGLPPMNQMDATSPLMKACFTDRPDFTPYTCLPNPIPLTEVNPPRQARPPGLRQWVDASLAQDFKGFDRADEDTLNRILWHAVRGAETPYPAHLAGAHGKGLAERGLSLTGEPEDD